MEEERREAKRQTAGGKRRPGDGMEARVRFTPDGPALEKLLSAYFLQCAEDGRTVRTENSTCETPSDSL